MSRDLGRNLSVAFQGGMDPDQPMRRDMTGMIHRSELKQQADE